MKNKKEILFNFFSLGSIDIIGLLIPIITMPILTRALGSELYGQYFVFLTILTFGHTIIDYGVHYSGVRDVAKRLSSIKKVAFYYENYQGLRFVLLITYLLVALMYSYLFFDEYFFYLISTAGVAYLIGYFLMGSWFFRAIGNTKWLLIASLLTRFTLLVVIVFFVKNKDDFILVINFSSYPILIMGVALFLKVRSSYSCATVSFAISIKLLKKGKDIFIGLLAPNLYNSIPIIILGGTSDPASFAKFAVATRVCGVVNSLQGVIASAVFPVLVRTKSIYVSKILYFNLVFAIPPMLVLFFFGDGLLTLFLGEEVGGENLYLDIIVFGIFFIAISNTLSQGFFVPQGYDILYRNVSIRVSLASFLINTVLIYHFGLLGGAIGLTVARMLFAIDYSLCFIFMKKASSSHS